MRISGAIFLDRLDEVIELLKNSPDGLFTEQVADYAGVARSTACKYLNYDIPPRLGMNDALVATVRDHRIAYRIVDKHDQERYTLKAEIKKLEDKLARQEAQSQEQLQAMKEENAFLRGKLEAYERCAKPSRRENVSFGKGGRMRDTTRVKDPIFEAVKAWGKEHPDVVVQMEYDALLMKIRFKMTWLPNAAFITEDDVDFMDYDMRKGSDQEFIFDVLDNMYKEGGYGHE